MQYSRLGYVFTVVILLFCVEKFNGHPIDMHVPTSHDFQFEYEYERLRAIELAEAVLEDADSSQEEIDKAVDYLYSGKGNRA